MRNFRYEITEDINEKIIEVSRIKNEYMRLYDASDLEIKMRLKSLSEITVGIDGSPLLNFKWFFEREKTIYSTLNLFKAEQTWFAGLCWCPKNLATKVDNVITELREEKKMQCFNLKEILDTKLVPPTKFKSNEFLNSFSDIIEHYGIPAYKEINPVVFTIVTFPFLFGVMFGDLAHGLIILAASIFLILRKRSIERDDGIAKPLLQYRYLLLLSGFFASFGGFITNDFAGMPLYLGKSCYSGEKNLYDEFYTRIPNCVSSIGIDPRWSIAKNNLQFMNSYRMKLSVLIGTAQMFLGISIKGLNLLYFNKTAELLMSFIPKLILLTTFLGYMSTLIISKWLTDWNIVDRHPPSLIACITTIFIGNSNDDTAIFLNNTETQGTLNRLIFGILCLSLISMVVLRPLYMFAQRYTEASAGVPGINAEPYEEFKDNEVKDPEENAHGSENKL